MMTSCTAGSTRGQRRSNSSPEYRMTRVVRTESLWGHRSGGELSVPCATRTSDREACDGSSLGCGRSGGRSEGRSEGRTEGRTDQGARCDRGVRGRRARSLDRADRRRRSVSMGHHHRRRARGDRRRVARRHARIVVRRRHRCPVALRLLRHRRPGHVGTRSLAGGELDRRSGESRAGRVLHPRLR
jgi:hypothetical protein